MSNAGASQPRAVARAAASAATAARRDVDPAGGSRRDFDDEVGPPRSLPVPSQHLSIQMGPA
jgi:hypothetical protein